MLFTQNGFKNSVMEAVPSAATSDFEELKQMAQHPQVANVNADSVGDFKANSLKYIVAGELDDGKRSNETFHKASLILVDFDEIPDEAAFLSTINTTLDKLNFILWPSISYGFKGARYHLAIEPSRPLVSKDEKEAVIYSISALLGIKSDDHMTTWVQMFSAPVITPVSKDKIIIHHGGPFDVEGAVANYVPAKKLLPAKPAVKQLNAKYPDEYVHELLTEYVAEKDLGNEADFSTAMIQLIGYFQQGDISETALYDAMDVLADGDSNWKADNQAKLEEHLKTQYEPNKVGFINRFKTLVPIYQRASEAQHYTIQSINLALAADTKKRLDEKQRELEAVDPKTKKTASLTIADAADILLKDIPMWMDRSLPNSPIYLYDPDKGIYTASDTLFSGFAHKVLPAGNSKQIADVYNILTDNDRVRNGKPIHEKMLVACQNGIFDLANQKLMEFSPRFHFTAKIATKYNPNAVEPVIKTEGKEDWKPSVWLLNIANKDQDVFKALFEVLGDVCQSSYTRRQAVWLVGNPDNVKSNGANGKSTFEALVEALVGSDNTAHLKVDQFSERFALNELMGKSVVIGDDVQAGKYIEDQSAFNSAVTGDTLRADIKNKQPINFTFSGTVIQSTNELPKFANQTGGTNRRLLIIPFLAQFDLAHANDAIKTDYVKRPAVREWILRYALQFAGAFDKFTQPKVSQDLLADFAKGNDQVANFMDETDWEKDKVVPLKWAYGQFASFCKDSGFIRPLSRPAFAKRMGEYGWTKKKTRVTHDNFKESVIEFDGYGEYFDHTMSCLTK